MIDRRLVSLGLEARKIGKDAGEGYLYECTCTIRPFELAEEILRQAGVVFMKVDTRILIDFTSDDSIVSTDFGLTLIKSLQLEELQRPGVGDFGVDVGIQERSAAIVAHSDEGLQRRIACENAAADSFHHGDAALCGD